VTLPVCDLDVLALFGADKQCLAGGFDDFSGDGVQVVDF
jgi:hypothetical protein